MFLIVLVACNKPQQGLLLKAEEGDVKIEIDSVALPELALFPIRVKLTNFADNKVVLVFDTITDVYEGQVRNLYLTVDADTFFIGVKTSENYLVFNERTTTSFLAWGYIWHGEKHFDSIKDIEPAFKNGKLVYRFSKDYLQNVNTVGMLSHSDTLLVPVKVESKTDKAQVLKEFVPLSYEWHEEKLKKK